MKMKRRLLLVAILILSVFLLNACGEKVVATVNGEKITDKELNKRLVQVAAMYGYNLEDEKDQSLKEYLTEQILQGLIEEKLILQEAEKREIKTETAEIEEKLKSIKAQFATEKEFKDFLEERKFSEKDLSLYLKNELILNKLFDQITKDVTETKRDIKGYYNDNKEEFYLPEQVQARNIVVNTEEEAKEIIVLLDKGADFADLAVEKSIDPTVADNRGDVGYFDREAPLVQEFKDAAFSLQVNEYTKEPVKSVFGYHIIKVEDKKDAQQRTFEDVKQELENRFIFEEKNEVFSNYIDGLLEAAKIEKMLPEKNTTQENNEENKN